ncbi:MAG: hypothetical protein O7A08_07045 [SAR324 cluster bacterium]|nr:hypothetical protein [SAR324 cluster bacterium]
MLQIDYTLIPLSADDHRLVDAEVARRIQAGEVPRLDKSNFGRVVVLNPDPVQTTHHVPDDLRANLRRIMLHTTEGPTDLRPDRLLHELLDSEDPLHILIIELKTPFAYFSEFLESLPKLRERYPDIGVILNTDQAHALEKLQEPMARGGRLLQLNYSDARGTIEIENPNELTQIISKTPDPVSLSVPFFGQIRLMLDGSDQPTAFNLDSLRKLQSQFGVGEAKEVDMGGGRLERVIVLDLPIRLIRDFQFRQDRGLDFHGIIRDGRSILSRDFEKEKLEYHWIPLRSVQSFMRKVPGEELQTVQVASTTVLRVNTFNGQVTFISRAAADQFTLDDVRTIGFRKTAGGAVGNGSLEDTGGMYFDRVVLLSKEYTETDPIQEAIREHILGRKILSEVERRRKLEIYTSRLKVGAVGPLAAQTLKILRKHGLESLIKPESFHYLCDLPQQLPRYYETPARFDEHFRYLKKSLRELMDDQSSEALRIRDYAHQMPVTMQWVDATYASFDNVQSQDLQVCYKELTSLMEFIGHEFRRNFQIGESELSFFNKIRSAQAAGLQAKWMADFKQQAYGPPLPPDSLPDFVFFGTPNDKQENDKSIFFPSFACTELIISSASRDLFEKVDYEFSVFLEEHMALAEHNFSEDGKFAIGLQEYSEYFDRKVDEAEGELLNLKGDLTTIDSVGSPEYQALLKKEEEIYHERYQAFLRDGEVVQVSYLEAGDALIKALAELGRILQLPPQIQVAGAEAQDDPRFDSQVIETGQTALRSHLRRAVGEIVSVLEHLGAKAQGLKKSILALSKAQADQKELLRSHALFIQSAQEQKIRDKAPARVVTLKKLKSGDRQGLKQRVVVQLGQISEERLQLQQNSDRCEEKYAQSLRALQGVLGRQVNRLQELSNNPPPGAPSQMREQIAGHITRARRILEPMGGVIAKMKVEFVRAKRLELRGQKLGAHLFALRTEMALLDSIQESSKPHPPEPAAAEGKVTGDVPAMFRENNRRMEQFAASVGELLEACAAGMQTIDAAAAQYDRAEQQYSTLEIAASRKARLRQSIQHLGERNEMMQEELADLPNRVRERFMPARKALLLRNFIPEEEKRILNFRRCKSFLEEILRLNFDLLRAEYLDRAVYRRFASNQFLRGAYVAVNTQHPEARSFQNVLPAVNRLFRTIYFNMSKQHPRKARRVSSQHLRTMEKEPLLEFMQEWFENPDKMPFDYLFLPSTFELAEAVQVMNHKDRIFRGVPRLVLIYVGKFSTSAILDNPVLRDDFFEARKHNVIVNIQGLALVDNPLAICQRLLEETLGSTFDTPIVEELPDEEDQEVAFKG